MSYFHKLLFLVFKYRKILQVYIELHVHKKFIFLAYVYPISKYEILSDGYELVNCTLHIEPYSYKMPEFLISQKVSYRMVEVGR